MCKHTDFVIYIFQCAFNKPILAVLDGEVAVPYYLQSAIAGLNSCFRFKYVVPALYKWQ